MSSYDVLVVGGGIVGLAHALEAQRRGLSVLLCERAPRAVGASIRNFGMVWPIGQPAGRGFQRALKSRAIYLDLAAKAGFWVEPVGSLHAVHHEDELECVDQFVERTRPFGFEVSRLSAKEAIARCPALRPERLLGALWSATELAVNPREVVAKLHAYLATLPRAEVRAGCAIRRIEHPKAELASGEVVTAKQIFVCGGDDVETLYPEIFRAAPVSRCKLQMMRTIVQPGGFRLGTHVAAGSTLRHYPVFKGLPALDSVRARFARDLPHFDRWGIHVMASQTREGEITIGDSHEYGDLLDPFDQDQIDRWILDYLTGFLHLPDLTIAQRWHGVYLKRMDGFLEFIHEPEPGVRIVTGLGGNGMTLSLGLAVEHFESLDRGQAWVPTPA
jgi:FAD dependent oxidoreductase TIGR03364